MEWIKIHPVIKKMIILAVVILAAWIIGQLAGPALVKAMFL